MLSVVIPNFLRNLKHVKYQNKSMVIKCTEKPEIVKSVIENDTPKERSLHKLDQKQSISKSSFQ